ncbi:MAG: four helix bundle protein [Melioribacteraceae bacterium]|jgi:four helix bundle protein|nr:four helix bundle protein [Melioribacteraceae bacterium]
MYKYSFEKLDVWQDSRKIIGELYIITKSFPDEEKFGLVSQIRRAAISIASNLAEGTSRNSLKDQAHFSNLAYSSLIEVLSHLYISNDLGFLKEETLNDLKEKLQELSNKINSLRNYQLNKSTHKHINK